VGKRYADSVAGTTTQVLRCDKQFKFRRADPSVSPRSVGMLTKVPPRSPTPMADAKFHALAKDAGNRLKAYILAYASGATGVFFFCSVCYRCEKALFVAHEISSDCARVLRGNCRTLSFRIARRCSSLFSHRQANHIARGKAGLGAKRKI
jgi:hypothetical protein